NAVLRIELSGQFVTANGSPDGTPTGLRLHAGDSVIQGLVINGFASRGIRILHVDANVVRNTIAGNFIGTDVTGRVALSNYIGIAIDGGQYNTVGGTTPGDRNLISGNTLRGINLYGNGAGPKRDQVQGNYIGTDVTGTAALGNGIGVWILSSQEETVGG